LLFELCISIAVGIVLPSNHPGTVMTSCEFFKMATTESQIYFWLRVIDGTGLRRSRSICIQISIRYYYFWFQKKTNGRHIGFYFRFRFWHIRIHR